MLEGSSRSRRVTGRVSKSGCDSASLTAELERMFGPLRTISPKIPIRWAYDYTGSDKVGVFRITLSRPWSIGGLGQQRIALVAPQVGSCRAVRGSHVVTAQPGQALLVQSGQIDHFEMIPADECTTVTLVLDEMFFHGALAELVEPPLPKNFGLAPLVDLTTGPGQLLNAFLGAFVTGLSNEAVLLSSPREISLTAEAVARLILRTLSSGHYRAEGELRTAALPNRVRRALDYMAANLQRPLTTPEIAASAHASIRSLEQAFQRSMNTTPMAYFRKLRLEAVRMEIYRHAESTSIAEIARRYGFVHVGRFAGYYKSEFGELPSETAVKARRRA